MDEYDIKAGDAIVAKGIQWDTDGNADLAASLPSEVTLTIPESWEAGDSVADLLSDEHGFCIFSIEELRRAA